MIRIFAGDDRLRAIKEVNKILGEEHETIDAASLTPQDLPHIFLGTTIFGDSRCILLRDFTSNSAVFSELKNYLNTPHEVILLETKLDKRTSAYKEIKDKVEVREFALPPVSDFRTGLNIYAMAKRDGKKAVTMLREVETIEDPFRFTGLLVSQALKDFERRQGIKEKRVLKSLAVLDIQMKSSSVAPWLPVESFILRLSD